MQKDSFSKRYIIKLSSSIIIVFLSTICQLLLPRALSIEEYGYYSYNLNVFTSIVVMANLSMSDALVSKLAKKNEDIGYVKYYLIFFSIIAITLNFAIIIIGKSNMTQAAFGEQTFFVLLLGLNVYIVNKLFTDVISMYDAMAISRFPAVMNIALKILLSVCITIGYFSRLLSLSFFYGFQICITSLVAAIMIIVILREQAPVSNQVKRYNYKHYLKEFYIFCKPMVAATIICKLVMIIMNWALMKWSGVAAQAMFGAAWQINTLIAYIYSPFAELLKREFAVEMKNIEVLRHRFRQSLQSVVWPVAYFAIFIMVAADWVLPIIYGDKYIDAILVTRIIMIYTVHVAWGQINGALYVSSERTRQYSIISIIGQFLTLICVFLFQIPNFIWPDSLGALGIALNYLVVNVIMVTVQTGLNAKYVGSNAIKDNLLIIPPLVMCTVFASISRGMTSTVIPGGTLPELVIKVIISGCIYTILLSSLIWMYPEMIGTTREKLTGYIQKVFNRGR